MHRVRRDSEFAKVRQEKGCRAVEFKERRGPNNNERLRGLESGRTQQDHFYRRKWRRREKESVATRKRILASSKFQNESPTRKVFSADASGKSKQKSATQGEGGGWGTERKSSIHEKVNHGLFRLSLNTPLPVVNQQVPVSGACPGGGGGGGQKRKKKTFLSMTRRAIKKVGKKWRKKGGSNISDKIWRRLANQTFGGRGPAQSRAGKRSSWGAVNQSKEK